MRIRPLALALNLSLLLLACTSPPKEPTVQAVPGATKPFLVFQQDQTECKAQARAQLGSQFDTAATPASTQDHFDQAYLQCMYARGNQSPGASDPAGATTSAAAQAGAAEAYETGSKAPEPVVPMSLMQAQVRLNELGYPTGKPDGKMTRKTRRALRNFQATRGLPRTGALDRATAAALGN